MADSSGALLLRAGAITSEQLARAQALEQREGGSLGECLVRIGAIDEEGLVEFYHKRLMVPRVPAAKLQVISPKVLAMVPADMAAEFRCIPIDADNEGGILVAMADPSDNHAVDEIAFFADRFVLRAVASESAIRRAIETHYGFRFTSAPAAAPAPEPAPAPPEKPQSRLEELEQQVVLLTRVKRSEETPLPIPIPPPADYQPRYAEEPAEEEPILLTKPKERERRNTRPGLSPVPDPPLAALKAAADREEVARLVLDYLAQMLERAVLFVIKKPLLVGNDARGDQVDPVAVRGIAIHLDAPSIFRDVVAARLPYRGPLPETAANRAFAQTMGGVGAEVLLMPIAVRERIIAVLFGDRPKMLLPDAALHAVCREAGLAYERLILQTKR